MISPRQAASLEARPLIDFASILAKNLATE